MSARTVSYVELVDDGDNTILTVERRTTAENACRLSIGDDAIVYCSLEDLATFVREVRAWIDAQGYDDPSDPWGVPQRPVPYASAQTPITETR